MKKLLLTLVFGILGVGVYGQTIKSLGYNTTNGQVVANTGTNVLTFTNAVRVADETDRIEVSPYSINGWNNIFNLEENYLRGNSINVFSWNVDGTNSAAFILSVPLVFDENYANIAAKSRTNLGLGNGITTNRSFVSYNGTNYTTNSVTISNGVITGWTQ